MRRTYETGLGLKASIYGAGVLACLGLDWGMGAVANHTYGPGKAAQYLEQSGYKDPALESIDEFAVSLRGCDRTDEVEYHFKAVALDGQQTQELVCKGIFKHATIRQG